jgi:hypothetical protein
MPEMLDMEEMVVILFSAQVGMEVTEEIVNSVLEAMVEKEAIVFAVEEAEVGMAAMGLEVEVREAREVKVFLEKVLMDKTVKRNNEEVV